MLEFVPAPPTPPATDWWCADCASLCFVNDECRCTGCAGELTVTLPSAELPVSRVRVVAEHQLAQGVELEAPAADLLPLISTPEDLARWLAVVVGSPGAELECAKHLDLKSELQDVAQHLLTELRRQSQDIDRLQSSIRAAAASAGLPLVIVSGSGRVLTLSTSDLVMALGEAAARGRLEAPAAVGPEAPDRVLAAPAAAERVTQLELEARRVRGLLQRATAALRALDAEVQAGSWRGAEQHLGAPVSDQSLRGLADHLEGELRRAVRG
jgi:hypothetical protein